jgi:NAD(P)-dependent dehydrogenase (short-subunit alcohol dehydrogenase family)
MNVRDKVSIVTGGASGLGRATADRLRLAGGRVVIVDADEAAGVRTANELGERVSFCCADIVDDDSVAAAVQAAAELGELRVAVHCAGGGSPIRVLREDRSPDSLDAFRATVELNLVSAFNVLRRVAAVMATNALDDGERGVCVLTSSIAAFDGQSAQLGYAAAKAGMVGMTLPAARDLSRHQIRVCTIAPGIFDTGMLTGLSDDTRRRMQDTVPHPRRFGRPSEFANAVMSVIENPMFNGECLRLDGALRLAGVDTQWGSELDDEVAGAPPDPHA